MNKDILRIKWKEEETYAFQGWDFSHLHDRWEDEQIPWDYRKIINEYIKKEDRLLDMGTGGGEFLLSLNHPYNLTTVTEAYIPNYELCKRKLEPLGITVVQVVDDSKLPIDDDLYDIVINRHESFDTKEVERILKPSGYFITQQVGGQNDNDLSNRLIENFKPQFPTHDLAHNISELEKANFSINFAAESFTPIRFFDVGALVFFAKIIEWEFSNFSVDTAFAKLCECQKEIEQKHYLQGTEHRFIIVAQKKTT